jgi:hypothetical protein
MINLQATFKEVNSYCKTLFVQIEKYVVDHDFEKQIFNERLMEPVDKGEFLHKTTTTESNHVNHYKIRPDHLLAYLIGKSSTSCEHMTKLISYVYSISCSNAFAEGVFSHIKHAWTASRNLMSSETVAAQLQIRLNCKMKCSDFFTFVQTEPELIKCARGLEKYSHIRKLCSI